VLRNVLIPLVLLLLLAPRAARAQCAPVTPVACENCFAVFVMPDTQLYSWLPNQPAGANHLDLVTRYICDHRSAWTEPTTGKTMPILMMIQLGDLVQRGDLTETVAGPLAEWKRVDAAFDNLDACTPRVPYLVTNGNHDSDDFHYERPSVGYGTYFGPDRWTNTGVSCNAPDDCDGNAGQYFLGGGETIGANSRNHDGIDGNPGPAQEQVGRHRAGLVRAPNGQRFLFLGLEMAFDFLPPLPGYEGVEQDDSAWPKQILGLYPDVATIAFHHSMLWTFTPPDARIRWGPEIWRSDSLTMPPGDSEDPDYALHGGMEELFDEMIAPHSQIRFLFTGHVLNPTHQADFTIPRAAAPPVWSVMRNYQRTELGLPGDGDIYGVGWNVIAVFDPDAEQVRIRSYRIDDVEAYSDPPVNYDHVGAPAPTECFETDQGGVGERVISWDFALAGNRTPSLSAAGLGTLVTLVLASASFVIRSRPFMSRSRHRGSGNS
jgi:hypothetical protein